MIDKLLVMGIVLVFSVALYLAVIFTFWGLWVFAMPKLFVHLDQAITSPDYWVFAAVFTLLTLLRGAWQLGNKD